MPAHAADRVRVTRGSGLRIRGVSRCPEPLVERCEVLAAESAVWLDMVEERATAVIGRHPDAVGVGDLVVDPREGPSTGPVHQGPGLPAQAQPPVLALVPG